MRYAKSRNGLIHLVNPLGGEHTMCGDAFDIDASDSMDPDAAWEYANRGPVTCKDCATVIQACRHVRINLPQ
jgi:hypothetical protein